MKNIIFIFIIPLLIISCEAEYDLQQSVYVPDERYNELPAYSEWGYNTFGGLLDRKPFFSNDYEVPLKIINTNDTTTFLFTGQIIDHAATEDNYYYYNDYKLFTLKIKFPELNPNTYLDLMSLNDSIIPIDEKNGIIEFEISNEKTIAQAIGGNIHIKRIQRLFIDEVEHELIISGTFNFQVILDGLPVGISNGRFDVGVAEHNFFLLLKRQGTAFQAWMVVCGL